MHYHSVRRSGLDHFKRFGWPLAICYLGMPLSALPPKPAELTRITITEEIVVRDAPRLGVHFSNDDYYDAPLLARRVSENFEGAIRRLHLPSTQPQKTGPVFLATGNLLGPKPAAWVGAEYRVLSGPDYGKSGRILSIEKLPAPTDAKKKEPRFALTLDAPIVWHPEINGLLLDHSDLEEGRQMPLAPKTVIGRPARQTPDVTLVAGDTPPGSLGTQACLLAAAASPSEIAFTLPSENAAPASGPWVARFWAKAKTGQPTLRIGTNGPGVTASIQPGAEWQSFEARFTIDPDTAKKNDGYPSVVFTASDGPVLIDDIEVTQDTGQKNPTVFRDGVVKLLRELRPGTLRYLRNNRNSLENSIVPPLLAYAHSPKEATPAASDKPSNPGGMLRESFGTHEFLTLCAEIDTEPYVTLPGTLKPEEMDLLMEYIAGPVDSPGGRLRQRLGHPAPWTQALRRLHFQVGNEVATFPGTGYWGPDYWSKLIARAKASPHYTPAVVFHVETQRNGPERVMQLVPNMDCLTIAGYMLFMLTGDQVKLAQDQAGLHEFMHALNWHRMVSTVNNDKAIVPLAAQARKQGIELSMYEGGNYHTTFGDAQVTAQTINTLIASAGGGLAATNQMLLQLRDAGLRFQNSFNFAQTSFRAGGSFGNIADPVKLWGGALQVARPGEERLRPRFVALMTANRVIGGDLVRTLHSPNSPARTFDNYFGNGYGPSRKPIRMTLPDVPMLYSYAFQEGDRRGLILVNASPRSTQDVAIEFAGQVRDSQATGWQMASADPDANNEPEAHPDQPIVGMTEATLSSFASGHRLTLPATSITALEWRVR